MKVEFNLHYQSKWGENVFISGKHNSLGNNEATKAIALIYKNNNLWSLSVDLPTENVEYISYNYFIKKSDGTFEYNGVDNEIIVQKNTKKTVCTFDQWISIAEPVTNFLKQPFTQIFYKRNNERLKSKQSNTFCFTVFAPQLDNRYTVCLLGNIDSLGNWNNTKAIPLQYNNGKYLVQCNVPITQNNFLYKYGIYDIKLKQFIQFENGENRFFNFENDSNKFYNLNDGFVNFDIEYFKGAGVSIPVFSLRSKNSFGVGEFEDIKLLAKWGNKIGLKIIQLLPINDTIETKTNSDIYPYAANSAFALHPLYLNLNLVGTLPVEHKLQKSFEKTKRKLNKISTLDYEATIKYKLAYSKELFLIDNLNFLESTSFISFFDANKDWLTYYAAYSYLRDKYKSTDFTKWGSYTNINDKLLQKLLTPQSASYKQIAYWYFLQYHLHLQLSSVVAYTHNLGIALKGDIPIGIGRTSCDAWQYPSLFNMNMQAGAPPDDFAVKGQNWGFPTYNWDAMQQNNFKWWKDRFAQMSCYFDAFRIDHILGFFRIWSIPLHAIDGILGFFEPALPVSKNEFVQNNIYVDFDKYTKPNFSFSYLQAQFGDKVDTIINVFFEQKNDHNYYLIPNYSTQKQIEQYFIDNIDLSNNHKSILLNCVNNVILFEKKGSNGNLFHFNIAMQKTPTFNNLDYSTQNGLMAIYNNYFYQKQDDFWEHEAYKKLPTIQHTTNMLICGEDLGMVPQCVPGVMKNLNILSLEVQRMPKAQNAKFVNLNQVPYFSIVTPSTHDMSTIRGWWEEDKSTTQQFYNNELGHYGEAPDYCEPWIALHIIKQHLQSPSIFSIFQLQDMFSIDNNLRVENPNEERINVPANPNHYWCYRIHFNLEDLLKKNEFNLTWQSLIKENNR